MDMQLVDVGICADSHTGDPVRVAFTKANNNFGKIGERFTGSVNFKTGPYSPTTVYLQDDVVVYNSQLWRAKRNVVGITPIEGADWTLYALMVDPGLANLDALYNSVSALALQAAGYNSAAQIAAQSAVAVSGLANLSAAARAIALDASTLAVGVYDTRRDSDGGAWVQKANTSLNNEALNTATRGSKAQYPTIMLLVGTATNFTIYDADDPSCPMWAVFNPAGNGGNANIIMTGLISAGLCVSASQGLIVLGGTSLCLVTIDLINDTSDRVAAAATVNTGRYLSNLADRNAGKGREGLLGTILGGPPITFSSAAFASVATTVAPHTVPNDARFRLPNPTIALASGGGIAVVRPDGVVVNSSSTVSFGRVSFDKNGTLYATAAAANSTVWIYDYPTYLSSAFAHAVLTNISTPAIWGVLPTGPSFVRGSGNRVALGAATAGLTLLSRRPGILTNSMVAYLDDWRNTLNQIGATKMACAESLRVLSSLQSTELLTNGSFATTLSGWTDISAGTGFASPTWDGGNGGRAGLQRVNAGNLARLLQNHVSAVGQTHRATVIASGAAAYVWVIDSVSRVQLAAFVVNVGTPTSVIYRPVGTLTEIRIQSNGDGTTAFVDDISIKAVIADHSPAGNHLEVVGTLNRTVVAVGAELAAIGGFSTSNYAQAPYSASMEPSAGEFSVSCAIVTTGGVTKRAALLDRGALSGTGAYYRLFLDGSGRPSFIICDGTNIAAVSAPNALSAGAHRVRGIRRGTLARIEIEVDGQIAATTTLTTMGSLNNASAVLRLGLFVDGTSPMDVAGPGLTGFGVSTTAPSIEQMRAAYADDIQAFQANAKCLLQGGSGVQDIGYDADTDLIYVAKSAGGTDVFRGLVNKGTILSTTSINKFFNSNFTGAVAGGAGVGKFDGSGGIGATSNGISLAIAGVGPGYVDLRWSGTATANGTFIFGLQNAGSGSSAPANPGEVWTFSVDEQIVGGSLAGVATHFLRIDRINASNSTIAATGAANFTPSSTNGRYKVTATMEANTAKLTSVIGVTYLNAAVIDLTVRLRRPQDEKAADFTSFVDGLTSSDNHKFVSAHDGNVLIATATGADIVMPALPLRSGVRGRRSAALYDADVSKFNGRTTADATPTFIGDPIFVPEGGKVDFLISVTAAVPGGTASELVTTLLKGRAHRNIGDAAATVFVSAASGSPALPDKTTGTMDATVASMGGGWIGVRATGKASTLIEWLGRQSLVRAAA